jgi:Sugar (and other) transporter
MYQSEIAPERIRGKLISLQQLCITFGILLAAVANVGLEHWEEVSVQNFIKGKKIEVTDAAIIAAAAIAAAVSTHALHCDSHCFLYYCATSPHNLLTKHNRDGVSVTVVTASSLRC